MEKSPIAREEQSTEGFGLGTHQAVDSGLKVFWKVMEQFEAE